MNISKLDLAFLFYYAEMQWDEGYDAAQDRDIEEVDISYYFKRWNELYLPELNKEHCGDCTNMPFTCTRCEVEGYIYQAENFNLPL